MRSNDFAYSSLIQPLFERAIQSPDSVAVHFLQEDGSRETIRAAAFVRNALAYARALRAIGLQPGDLVVLVLRHSQAVLYAFWGALALGAVASIFPFLTEKLDPQIYKERVKTLVAQSGARAVITFPEFESDLRALLAEVDCPVLNTDQVPVLQAHESTSLPETPEIPMDQIAFLQHSSGTTGLQKGVALSHRAVLNQIRAYSRAIALDESDVIVSWLPLYHDMGLIAGFLMPLITGVPLVLMSPFAWVRRPLLLMQAISEFRGTLCWLPNFAYNHSVRGIREREMDGLDLSSLRMVINCSEPVRYDSHRIFYEHFKSFGLRLQALSTCYAMAENTFAVTQARPGKAVTVDWIKTTALQEKKRAIPGFNWRNGALPMVSCGRPIEGVSLRIVDANRRPLPERHIGEIALRSDSMLSEYHRRPALTAEALVDGWYYTGDIGYRADGELYICGRKKDLIIVGGKNIFPQDLEAIANTIPGLCPGRSVAFGMLDESLGSEIIVMVCELTNQLITEEERQEIEHELRRRISQQTEVNLDKIYLVNQRWLIKTSSGKIARLENKDKYLKEARQF